jgi:hypothetical protein
LGAFYLPSAPGNSDVRHHPSVISASVAALSISAALFAGVSPAVDPPARDGPWRELGASVTSRPGKLAHFFRVAKSPTGLAVVAVSTSSKPIRLTWFSYCEFESDDAQTEENQATIAGRHRLTAFPRVLDGATLCNVSVTIRVVGGRAAAAVFAR